MIQAHLRGRLARGKVRAELARAFSPPDLEKAKAHARSFLPHDENRNLLPINCPLSCF